MGYVLHVRPPVRSYWLLICFLLDLSRLRSTEHFVWNDSHQWNDPISLRNGWGVGWGRSWGASSGWEDEPSCIGLLTGVSMPAWAKLLSQMSRKVSSDSGLLLLNPSSSAHVSSREHKLMGGCHVWVTVNQMPRPVADQSIKCSLARAEPKGWAWECWAGILNDPGHWICLMLIFFPFPQRCTHGSMA